MDMEALHQKTMPTNLGIWLLQKKTISDEMNAHLSVSVPYQRGSLLFFYFLFF